MKIQLLQLKVSYSRTELMNLLTSSRLISLATSWSLSSICTFSLSPSLTESDNLHIHNDTRQQGVSLPTNQVSRARLGQAHSPYVKLASLGVRPGLEVHHVGHSRSQLLFQLKPQTLLPLQGQGGAALLAVQRSGQAGAGHLDGVGRPRQLVAHVRQVPATDGCTLKMSSFRLQLARFTVNNDAGSSVIWLLEVKNCSQQHI